MKVLQGDNGKFAKIWVDELYNIDSLTLDQIKTMLQFPFLHGLAIMPDCHFGKGAVVGAVMATNNTVVPDIVGFDIGCGATMFNTGVAYNKEYMNEKLFLSWKRSVLETVPTGFNKQKIPAVIDTTPLSNNKLHEMQCTLAPLQMSTLGGGNHFCEIQYDENNILWLTVHSGSRQIGLQIAKHHNQVAKEINTKYSSNTPQDMWFLRLEDVIGQDYMNDMQWAVNYASANRKTILKHMYNAFMEELQDPMDDYCNLVDVRHNFARLESHNGKNVVVHRKGAISAREGEVGVILGSMGSATYIVKGSGNPESFNSCSHGAGRIMSRNKAKAIITKEDLRLSLVNTFTSPSSNIIDESPGAYKDIENVMANQTDLVEVIHTLHPIITIKG